MENLFKKAASFLDRAPDLWKENVELIELNRRFLWFILLRFGVVAVMLVLGFTKEIFLSKLSIHTFNFPLLAGVIFILNIIYWLLYEWAIVYHEFPKNTVLVVQNVQIQIILDFFILGFLTYECGGLESPLIYFFLFHNTLSCLFFSRRTSILHTMLSITIILAIFFLASSGALPERHFIDSTVFGITVMPKEFATYYLVGVISIFLTLWYLVSTITKSLRAEDRELQKKIQEMIDLSREKTRYMLVTTHELKAPFAAIQSYVNVALSGYAGEVPKKIGEILKKINARCDLLTRRIIDMIQLANIASLKERRQTIPIALVNISEILANTARHFENIASSKNISFELSSLCNHPYVVSGNAPQLDTLFNNIIANAIFYSFPSTVIRITATENESSITVRVTNNGIGIKPEQLEKVFLEHFRTERAVEMNPNSTGLGLTIARQIMDIHNGDIWIESEENAETTVYMEFPKLAQ